MMSGLERIDVDTSSGRGPTSMIVKFPATNEANLAVATAFDLYRREVLYYRDIAPRSKAWTPTIHYADIADDGVDFLLVMEDLSDYRLGDQVGVVGSTTPEPASTGSVGSTRRSGTPSTTRPWSSCRTSRRRTARRR